MDNKIVKVKSLVMFADDQSETGLRNIGEVFECTNERFKFLNDIHKDFDLVELIEVKNASEDMQVLSEDNVDEEKPKNKKKGKKSTNTKKESE